MLSLAHRFEMFKFLRLNTVMSNDVFSHCILNVLQKLGPSAGHMLLQFIWWHIHISKKAHSGSEVYLYDSNTWWSITLLRSQQSAPPPIQPASHATSVIFSLRVCCGSSGGFWEGLTMACWENVAVIVTVCLLMKAERNKQEEWGWKRCTGVARGECAVKINELLCKQ